MTERGMVTEIRDRLVTVQLEETEGCAGCHNDSCKTKRQAIQAWNRDRLGLSEGDEVEVEVSGAAQLEGALWVLGLPLATFVLGYFAVRAFAAGASELPAALGGLVGLALGMAIGVRAQKRKKVDTLPRVLRTVEVASDEASAGGQAGPGAAGQEPEGTSFENYQG